MAQFAYPTSDISNNASYNPTPVYAQINDQVGTTFAESANEGSSTVIGISMADIGETAGSGTAWLRIDQGKDTGNRQLNFAYQLRDANGVLLVSNSYTNISGRQVYTDSFSDGNITDWENPFQLTLTPSHSGGGQPSHHIVYDVEVEFQNPPNPSQVTDLTISNQTLNTADLTWTAASQGVGPVIRQELWAAAGGTGWTKIADLSPTASSYAYVTTLTSPSEQFDYVRIDSVGYVFTQQGVSETINWGSLGKAVLTVTDNTLTSIDISWAAVQYADDYEVFVDDVSQGLTSNATTFQKTGLTEGTQYKFEVKSIFNEDTDTSISDPYFFSTASSNIPLQINVGGAWKVVQIAKINVGGAWKDVSSMKQAIGGTWKDVY